MPRWTKTALERLFEKTVAVESGCIEWRGSANQKGYGMMFYKGRIHAAHRVSWQEHSGTIPDGLLVLHHCDNPRCVNPEHLFLGTNQDNMDDMKRKGRQRAAKGEAHARSKLTWSAVREIRASNLGQKDLALRFNVTEQTVWWVRSGKGWKEPPT